MNQACALDDIPVLHATQEGPYFSEDDFACLQTANLPKHIAIIPDGNRRWAGEMQMPYVNGYIEGAQILIRTALAAKELSIPVLTAYSFSTENWTRPEDEISLVMKLFDVHLNFYAASLVKANIRLHIIGDIARLPLFLRETIERVTQQTASGTSLDLVLAMNYGGRNELVRAFRKLAALYQNGSVSSISEETVSQALDTHPWPDPDLIIRTSGEQRLSNFLLWQSSYAEVYTDAVHWPKFTPQHLLQAIVAYQTRRRRHGGGEAT